MLLPKGADVDRRSATVVELDRAQIDEMLRAYVVAKFQIPATQFHDVQLKVLPDRFIVRVIDPPTNPIS